ncbi:hypothetical protein [Grimontia sp. SpTr1]|uniref:hypothetical protein n=1 Tax=Grimontia sp. SpTr1 TaxID=2995319 RepID=UPI00248CE70A|nr:hypothetical protein [Grimontia sp. SpTr1]
MKNIFGLFPYFQEKHLVEISDTSLETRISSSKLEGSYSGESLKLTYKSWLGNAFGPVAVCQVGNQVSEVVVTYRPRFVGCVFYVFWTVFILDGLISAIYNTTFLGALLLALLALAGYGLIQISFWVEVPRLKREVRSLFGS